MRPAYEYGNEVRLIRNVRNDGSYPGKATGELLIKRGSVGCVYDVGTFLQDQLIYKVHFVGEGKTVGCREEELIPASDPWVYNTFEFNEKVRNVKPLAIDGQIIVAQGTEGRIMKVLRDSPAGVQYHVTYGDGRIYQVPESSLEKSF